MIGDVINSMWLTHSFSLKICCKLTLSIVLYVIFGDEIFIKKKI